MSNMASDAKACFSSKFEYCAVIWYLYLKGKTGKKIQGELADVYGSSAPSYAQVKFRVGDIKRGSLGSAVWDLVYSDRRIQVEEIVQALSISHGSVSTILHDRIGMRKLTACWVPKSLSDEQMATRASVCSALFKHFRSENDVLLRLVTVDETWVHYYEPENKAQSHQWVGPGSRRPKTFKTQPSTGKVMDTVFLDAKGVIMLDFLPKRSTITGLYYSNLLDHLRTSIHENAEVKFLKVFCCNRTTRSQHFQSCNGCCRVKWV